MNIPVAKIAAALLVLWTWQGSARADDGGEPPPTAPPAPTAPDAPSPAPPEVPTGPVAPPPTTEAPPTPEALPTSPPATPAPAALPAPTVPPVPMAVPLAPPARDPSMGAPRFAVPCDPVPVCCPPRWRFELVGFASFLTPDPEGAIGEPTGANDLTWNSLSYGLAAGGSATLSVTTPACPWTLTGRVTYYGSWDDGGTARGVFGARPTPGGPVVVSPTVDTRLSTEADLFGAEINATRCLGSSCGWTFEGGGGLRYLRFDESVRADFLAPVGGGPASVAADVENTFLGAQLVGGATRAISSCLDLRFEARVFGGWVHRRAEVNDADLLAGGAHRAQAEADDAAFGGELELAALWHLNGCVSLVGGYGLLVASGLQRADHALDFTQAATGRVGALADDPDAILVHRIFLGVSFDF